MYRLKLLFVIYVCFGVMNSAVANNVDYQQCTKAITYYEAQYNLPRNLLHSIATVESGQWNKQHQRNMPSPWTLNASGKAYYFSNQAEAVTFLKELLAKGIDSVDTGCAQINWRYHGKKYFKKPEHAFDPAFNVAYAAHLLSKNYEETRSWNKAVAFYHSRTAEKGKNYAAKVEKVWKSYGAQSVKSHHTPQVKKQTRTHHKIIIGQSYNDSQSKFGVTKRIYNRHYNRIHNNAVILP